MRRHQYVPELVGGLVRMLAAKGGVLWSPAWFRPKIDYQYGLDEAGTSRDQLRRASHAILVTRTLTMEKPWAIPPHEMASSASEGENPTDCLILMAPVTCAGRTKAVVEIFQRPGAVPGTVKGYLRFVDQMCELAARSEVFAATNWRSWWRR